MSYDTFGRRELMLGLIYPAVLGTVFYSLLASTAGPAVPVVAAWLGHRSVASPTVPFQPFKALLLLLTFIFYLGDYFYVMYTKEYLKRFFFFSVLFLAGLALTVAAIGAERPSTPTLPVIMGAYAGFMSFYFLWDATEWLRDRDKAKSWMLIRTNDRNERWFYPVVFVWEIGSFVILAAMTRQAVLGRLTETRVLSVLTLVTALFVAVAVWKRVIYVKWVCRQSAGYTYRAN